MPVAFGKTLVDCVKISYSIEYVFQFNKTDLFRSNHTRDTSFTEKDEGKTELTTK